MTVVILSDRPKSIRNPSVIEQFGYVFVLSCYQLFAILPLPYKTLRL